MLFFYRSFKDRLSWKVNFSWGFIFIGFGVFQLIEIEAIFYTWLFTWFNILFFYVIFLSIILLLEYFLQKYIQTKYLFTALLIILGVLELIAPQYWTFMASLGLICLLVFGILFFWKLLTVSSGTIRSHFIIFMVALVAKVVGWALILVPESLIIDPALGGLIIRIIQIGALILIGLVLVRLPIFFELDWRKKLIQLFVVVRNGIPIVHLNFQDTTFAEAHKSDTDGDLAAAGMVGITTMLKEISHSDEELKIIDHKDTKIMLEHGTDFFIALFVREDMNIYWDKLARLHKTIENYFGNLIRGWDGNLNYFKPLEVIVKNEFQ